MNDLERLVALHEIGQRMALYCNAMDDHDWPALRPIFTDDAAIGGLDGVPPKGPDHFITWLGEVIPEEMKTMHHVHNLQVDFISDTEADMRCDFAAPTWHRGVQAPFKIRDDWGSYLGRCRKTAQGWRVVTFTIQKSHSVVAHIGATGAAAPRPTTIGSDKVALGDVERLVAIEEIRQLKARYCAAVDERDGKALRAVFADDAVLGPMLGVSFENADAFVTWIIKTLSQGATTVHHVHNFQVEFLSATEAKGRWRFEFWNWWGNTLLDGGHGFGDYWQYYRKTADGWRISGFGGALPVASSGAAKIASASKKPLPDLEWLVAVEEIKALKARYCAAVDDRDWKKLRSVFAEDVDFGEMRGTDDNAKFATPDQFVAWLSRALPKELVTAHHVHNFQVDWTSATEATGRCELVASVWWTGAGPGPFASRMEWGSYRDRYRKTAQGWRMVSLGAILTHATEEHTAGRMPPWTAFSPVPK